VFLILSLVFEKSIALELMPNFVTDMAKFMSQQKYFYAQT
jgi:hypothetical protein